MNRGMGNSDITPLVAAAHELKAPLGLIRQLAFRLDAPNLSSAERHELVQRAILTSDRALRLTSNLTRSARLDDPALFNLEPINAEALCRDVASELAPLFDAYGRSVLVQTYKHPLLLVANRDLLRRILLGFNDNALHYSAPGSAVSMQIQAFRQAGLVRIGVRDYGPALSSDMWRKLQKKLRSAPQPIQARPESSGLGLFIASQFAEAMNGRIGAIRHKDGATFYVELQASSQLQLL